MDIFASRRARVNWFYDREDPEEALIVDRLKQIYLLTDQTGTVLEISGHYKDLGVESPKEIRDSIRSKETIWKTKRDPHGVSYLIRQASLLGEDEKPYLRRHRPLLSGRRTVGRAVHSHVFDPLAADDHHGKSARLVHGRPGAVFRSRRWPRPRSGSRGKNLRVQIPSRGANDELDRLIDAFNRMIERLDASFQQTKQFSTDVSHELRTPLTAIRGQLEVALLAAKTTEQYQDAILNALEDVERLSQTIRALLQLSQAESGQVLLQKQPIDLPP